MYHKIIPKAYRNKCNNNLKKILLDKKKAKEIKTIIFDKLKILNQSQK